MGQKTLLVRKIIKKHDFWGKKWVGDQKQGKKRQKTAFLGSKTGGSKKRVKKGQKTPFLGSKTGGSKKGHFWG